MFAKKRIELHNLKDAFISQGPIAKRLKCGSIYIIPENGKIAVLVDIENPQTFLEKIQNSRPWNPHQSEPSQYIIQKSLLQKVFII